MREVETILSRIEQVTVFARGARIRRVATVAAPSGPGRVRIEDLPLTLVDDSLRVQASGGAVVTAVRAGLTTPAGDVASEEPADLREARSRLELTKAEVQRLELALDRLTHAKVVVEDEREDAPAAWSHVLAARRALVTARAERQLALRHQLIGARKELGDAERAFEVIRERVQSASTARAARAHEVRKHVELDLTPSGTSEVSIHLEYQVVAARWAPSYVARLDGDRAQFELRAVVAQDSGEDWSSVRLRLSTAEPDQFAPLPELHAQKIGRRQAEPPKKGFRAPPAGAEALYADYMQRFPETGSPLTGALLFDEPTPSDEVSEPPAPPPKPMAPPPLGGMAPPGMAMPMPSMAPQAMPAMMPMSAPRKSAGIAGAIAGAVGGAVAAPFALAADAMKKRDEGGGGGGLRRRGGDVEEEAAAGTPPARLDYGNLRMAPAGSIQRGKLVPAPRDADTEATRGARKARANRIQALFERALPTGHVGNWSHTYDYAFDSDGTVDVASDGAWHSLALTSRPGTAALRHVSVPREQADVFRVATITNPFDGPLLPGPIDVYDRGQFLLTSQIDLTAPGGKVEVGLGVDATVKIARNTEFHEEAAGMLRGALRLIHGLTIEVENLSPRAIDLEVRERVPVTREGEDDIEVSIGKAEPAWERWTPDTDAPQAQRLRGGQRWRLEVAPKAKKTLRASYEIKIATKNELVGGNRRES